MIAVLAGALATGAVIFQIGFRLTSDVPPIVLLLVLSGAAFALARPRYAWLWGVAIGIGARLIPEPPLSAQHIAREGASRPLPLPLGLTGHAAAQSIAGTLVMMMFPLVGAALGWAVHKMIRGSR